MGRRFPNNSNSLGVVVVCLAGLAVAACAARSGAGTSPESRAEPVTRSVDWQAIDELIAEQKYQAAREAVASLRQLAHDGGTDSEWARALVLEVQLTAALGGVETAVRLLDDLPWPEGVDEQAILRLLRAHSLVRYLEVYDWEIGQRERVASVEQADLQQWTRVQIVAAINGSYAELWATRERWGSRPVGALEEYLEGNDYPSTIRGTLRDVVSYLWAGFLANSAYWQPADSHDLYTLDLEALAASGDRVADEAMLDTSRHPLERFAAVLGDLEHWHSQQRRPEAALEALLERLRHLESSLSADSERAMLRTTLETALDALGGDHPWWSVGQAQLARIIQAEGHHDSLVAARAAARAGLEAHPDSVGGRRCASLVASFEAPALALVAMRADGVGKRSILVRHKNLEALYLRAYALDLEAVLARGDDYQLLPGHRRIEALLASDRAEHSWRVELPATPDLQSHQTFVTPPLERPGLYVIIASAREDFALESNRLEAVNLIVGDLVLLARPDVEGIDVDVRSGASGEPLADVEVTLWQLDYRAGHRRAGSARTASDGRARLAVGRGRRQDTIVVVKRGADVNFQRARALSSTTRAVRDSTEALIFTDRSVYRPEQRLLWKVVAYQRLAAEEQLEVAPGRELTVELVDANHELVAAAEVESNHFGSASGEFQIPAGRLLGGWHLRTSLGGHSAVQVEEYKRPTFEVELAEPEAALRLNQPARLAGEARYYFGLPVVEGGVDWRVTRRPRYPRWWGWFRPVPRHGEQLLAAGSSQLDADGRFEIEFTPAADERQAERGVTYHYALSVEVTDAGGETRSATRSYRLGFVAVEATIELDGGFLDPGERPGFEILRTDLDGVARAGRGRWRLVTLAPPPTVTMPAEQPALAGEEGAFQTPGDRLLPRWAADYSVARRLRTWGEGELLAAGELEHGVDGRASVEPSLFAANALEPGAKRLVYSTEDAFGGSYETQVEFVVAGPKPLALPALLAIDEAAVLPGESARVLVGSGFRGQQLLLEIARPGRAVEERRLVADGAATVIELPITESDRGGVRLRLTALRDHQLVTLLGQVSVPAAARDLKLRFATFRDLLRPGARERWRIEVTAADDQALAAGAAELLAYMYDRSLDLFAQHSPPTVGGFSGPMAALGGWTTSLGQSRRVWHREQGWYEAWAFPYLRSDRLRFFDSYGIGGPGRRGQLMRRGGGPQVMAFDSAHPLAAEAVETMEVVASSAPLAADGAEAKQVPPAEALELRSDFSETAFWEPHLITDAAGAVSFEFTVPDAVTEWNVWVHALSRELDSGRLQQRVRTVKELLVRPYLPRFLREGDEAELRVVVQNAGEETLSGTLDLDLLDPDLLDQGVAASVAADFGLTAAARSNLPFTVAPGESVTLTFTLAAPRRLGTVAVEVVGRAGDVSDGERRPLPLLPGRFHLVQSRFVALQDSARRELTFADLAADDDGTRIDEQLVVTLDAQLFYSVLGALPYLVNYPYECTEQTLNRFLSTGIVSSVFDDYPAVARMATELAARETPLELWVADDANRRMALEETPWLLAAAGGDAPGEGLAPILDARVANAQRDASLAKLVNAQTSSGGFPWWPGGPPSAHMTLYIASGLSRALEFGIELPKSTVVRAWQYLHRHYIDELVKNLGDENGRHEAITYLNYVLSNYPDSSWTGDVFTADDRQKMLDHSFAHWRQHSPLLKSYLALTLQRVGRGNEARLVFDSVMDSARTTEDEGTFWAPEERAWLWYNDTIESHALALRTLGELAPDDERRQGLVHWLMLNKKLNHWQSTRATAEVIYSLVHYLEAEGQLGVREAVRVEVGGRTHDFVFEPDEYTGKNQQLVIAGADVEPARDATIVVEKETPGLLFASASWHYSTEELPEAASGDFFRVERSYFKRVRHGDEWVLEPIAEGARLAVGDQLEVQLSLRAKHAAEYVHLRDPRAAGFEPETVNSSYKSDLGIGWYEQVRDSGTDFFFEALPAGEYNFKYRLRASLGGIFKAAPATVQSMYAPEFNAFSSGTTLSIGD